MDIKRFIEIYQDVPLIFMMEYIPDEDKQSVNLNLNLLMFEQMTKLYSKKLLTFETFIKAVDEETLKRVMNEINKKTNILGNNKIYLLLQNIFNAIFKIHGHALGIQQLHGACIPLEILEDKKAALALDSMSAEIFKVVNKEKYAWDKLFKTNKQGLFVFPMKFIKDLTNEIDLRIKKIQRKDQYGIYKTYCMITDK